MKGQLENSINLKSTNERFFVCHRKRRHTPFQYNLLHFAVSSWRSCCSHLISFFCISSHIHRNNGATLRVRCVLRGTINRIILLRYDSAFFSSVRSFSFHTLCLVLLLPLSSFLCWKRKVEKGSKAVAMITSVLCVLVMVCANDTCMRVSSFS